MNRPSALVDRRACLLALVGIAGAAGARAQGVGTMTAAVVREPTAPGASGVDGAAAGGQAQLERRLLDGCNAARRVNAGMAPLTADARLSQAARDFARYMATTGRYGHEADGRDVATRLQAAGYTFCFGAENLAWIEAGGGDEPGLADSLLAGWLASPSHRSNLLGEDWTDTGVAVALSPAAGRHYAVQLFGRPAELQLDFSIENRSGGTVGYLVDQRPFELRPRQTRVHRQCRPAQIVVTRADGSAAPISRAAGGERYAVDGSDAALVLLARR